MSAEASVRARRRPAPARAWAAVLAPPTGGLALSVEAVRAQLEVRLARAPRIRERLLEAAGGNGGSRFDITRHVLDTDSRTIEGMVDEATSKPLPRGRPAWQLWVAERLEDDCIGVVARADACLVGSLDAAELMAALLDPPPDSGDAADASADRALGHVAALAGGHALDLALFALQYARSPGELVGLPRFAWQAGRALANSALAAVLPDGRGSLAPGSAVFDGRLAHVRPHIMGCELRYAYPLVGPVGGAERSNGGAPARPALSTAAARAERARLVEGFESTVEEVTAGVRAGGAAGARAGERVSYEDLYARWETGNWQATEIDFSQDRIDWRERLTPAQRRGALWLLSLFLNGEEAVAEELTAYIDAAPRPEQKHFLASQQIDEARHAVFFSRFMQAVVDVGEGDVSSGLEATAGQLGWGHHQLFARLARVTRELRNGAGRAKLAEAVTLYHIVAEATIAQPGQLIIGSALERLDVLPGLREGMRRVELDEQRHVAFGVRMLSDLHREDPRTIQDAIVDAIRDALPATLAIAIPPDWDRSHTESLGFELEDLYEEAARAQEARLRAVGLPLEQIPHLPLQIDLPPRERATRAVTLLEAGVIGPRRPAGRYEQAAPILFDELRRHARGHELPPSTKIQLDFTDAEPWYLSLDGAVKEAHRGRVADPSVRIRTSLEDFVDIVARRTGFRALMLRGRLVAAGDPRVLRRLPRLFI